MNIHENLRETRKLKGHPQEHTVKYLKISQLNYIRIELTEIEFNLNKLEKISKILEPTYQQIIGLDEKLISQNCPNTFDFNESYYADSAQEKEQFQLQIEHLKSNISFLRNQVEPLAKK